MLCKSFVCSLSFVVCLLYQFINSFTRDFIVYIYVMYYVMYYVIRKKIIQFYLLDFQLVTYYYQLFYIFYLVV